MKKINLLSHLKLWIGTLLTIISTMLQAQTITGTTFFDGNNNGVKDATETGFPFVTVKAYDASNTAVATAISLDTPAADIGKYTLTGLTAGTKYRIEFTLPSGYNDGAYGSGSNTSVQFVTANATNLDCGLYVPGELVAGTNPALIFGCALFVFSGNTPGLASYLYGDKTVITTPNAATVAHTDDALASEVGIPFAMGYKSTTKHVFFTSVTATNTFGYLPPAPDGPSAIYVADYSGTSGARVGNGFVSKKLLMKLTDVAGIDVSNQFPIANDTPRDGIDDLTKNTAFGLSGLGGIDVSDDGQKLYVINMGNGSLVKINISGLDYRLLPATKPTVATIITIPTSATACMNGRFRPSVVKIFGNKAYIAGICDASTGTAAGDGTYPNLNVIVLAMDLATETFTKAFEFAPSFKVGSLNSNIVTNQIKWGWYQQYTAAPFQPVVSDIAFDDEGALIIGMINRKVFGEITNNDLGYLVRAARTATGWQLENAGTTGPYITQAATNNTGTGNSYDIVTGPGDKWFFEQGINDVNVSGGSRHRFLFSGGVFVLPNSGEVVAGYTDPEWIGSFGTRYLNLKTGKTKAYANIGGQKVFAITSAEAVGDAAPIEIGNRVWDDTDGDGIQDPAEAGISGVTVRLTDIMSMPIPDATAITDANGNYIFSTATGTNTTSAKYGLMIDYNSDYILEFPTTVGTKTVTLGGTGANRAIDSDADMMGSVNFTTGSSGQNNHSYDVGYKGNTCIKPIAKVNGQSMCEGGTPKAFTAMPSTGVTYKWYGPLNDTTSTLGTAVSGQTAVTYTPTGTFVVGKKYYAVIATNTTDVTCSDTAFAALTILAKPAIIKICQGETYTITVEAGTANIKWYKDGIVVADSTRSSFIVKTIGSYTYSGIKAGGDLCQDTLCCPFIFEACCPTITQSADTTICAGSTIVLRATLTNISTQDIKFVYFNTHQTVGSAIYGTPDGVLGTVTNAQLTASKTKAALSVTILAAPASKTYHVYAILSPAPTDATCRPFGHRHVITDPTKCAPVPCGLPDCLGITIKKR